MTQVTDFTALLSETSLNGATGKPAFVTYSFPTSVPSYLNGLYPAAGLATFQPFTDAYKALARQAIQDYAAVSGLAAFEVPAGQGDIQFMIADTASLGVPSAGFTRYPGSGINSGINSDIFIDSGFTQNGTNLYLLLHELGHALGLKHGYEGTLTLDPSVDDAGHSVLSSHLAYGFTGGLGSFDVQAVQHLYGNADADGTQVASWSWDSANYVLTQTGFDTANRIVGVGAGNIITTGAAADYVDVPGYSTTNMVSVGDGDDTVYFGGSSGATRLVLGAGNDKVYGSSAGSVVTINGGDGNDYISLVAGGGINVDGGGGSDTLVLSGIYHVPTYLDLSAAGNSIQNVETIYLSGADLGDHFVASSQDTSLSGFYGDDVLSGGRGNDTILGSDGDDTLSGGMGRDYLNGGVGSDRFVGTEAELNGDTIGDFARGDRITITDADPASFTYTLNGSTLSFAGGSLTLANVSAEHLRVSAGSAGGVDLRLAPHALNDFDGDGRSDILWRNDGGALTDWLAKPNGAFIDNSASAGAYAVVGADWHIADMGDFNGDGHADIAWRNDSGAFTDWLGTARGGFTDNSALASTFVGTDWHIAGTGDFNGDGRGDIIWRNDSGALTDWLGTPGGGFFDNSSTASAFAVVGTDWHIAGTGDVDGDGRTDILWRNDNGALTDWLGTASGGFVDNSGAPNAYAVVGTDWKVAGVGDFNGDGLGDILWRDDGGALTDWLGTASGGFIDNAASAYTTVGADWKIADTGDYNGDGRSDILWRNDGGALTDWLGQANGGFVDNAASAYGFVGTDWHIQPRDHAFA